MAQKWYYTRHGEQAEPVSDDQLQTLLAAGQIESTEHVWKEGAVERLSPVHALELLRSSQVSEKASAEEPPPFPPGFVKRKTSAPGNVRDPEEPPPLPPRFADKPKSPDETASSAICGKSQGGPDQTACNRTDTRLEGTIATPLGSNPINAGTFVSERPREVPGTSTSTGCCPPVSSPDHRVPKNESSGLKLAIGVCAIVLLVGVLIALLTTSDGIEPDVAAAQRALTASADLFRSWPGSKPRCSLEDGSGEGEARSTMALWACPPLRSTLPEVPGRSIEMVPASC